MKIMLGALVNRDINRLERLIKTVKDNNILGCDINCTVVCNTLDDGFAATSKALAEYHKWDYIRTESNGRPGQGKNSMYEYFAKSSYDYLIAMDGDDFLYPNAIARIKELIITSKYPDVIGFQTNDCLAYYHEPTSLHLPLTTSPNTYLYSWFGQNINCYKDAKKMYDRSRPVQEQRTPDRLVVLSKKAAKVLRCPTDLKVSEDYIMSLQAAALHVKGELVYTNTSQDDIYIKDEMSNNSVCKIHLAENNDQWTCDNDMFMASATQYLDDIGEFYYDQFPFYTIPNALDWQGKLVFVLKHLMR